MTKKYIIYYNDGAYYGKMTFNNQSHKQIENRIKKEIEANNSNPNPLYHINRSNFIEIDND